MKIGSRTTNQVVYNAATAQAKSLDLKAHNRNEPPRKINSASDVLCASNPGGSEYRGPFYLGQRIGIFMHVREENIWHSARIRRQITGEQQAIK